MVMGEDLRARPLGTALILIGIASWSLGTVLSQRVETPPGTMGFAAEMLAGGAMALVLSVAFRETWTFTPAARVWWAWSYLVVFGSLIGFSAYRYLVDRVSATLATSYAYVNPLVGLLVGWGLGHERFSANVLIGLPIVLGSVGSLAWVQFRSRRPTSRAPQGDRAARDSLQIPQSRIATLMERTGAQNVER
jgi:drug/metabolite transporter (DMT)-like permease